VTVAFSRRAIFNRSDVANYSNFIATFPHILQLTKHSFFSTISKKVLFCLEFTFLLRCSSVGLLGTLEKFSIKKEIKTLFTYFVQKIVSTYAKYLLVLNRNIVGTKTCGLYYKCFTIVMTVASTIKLQLQS
jgi:hypothetical protein